MPFALILIGLILFIAAYQNNVAALGAQLKSDFVGSGGFMVWVVALFIVGAIGYVPQLRVISRMFLALILVVIFLGNSGVFTTLSELMTGAGNAADDQVGDTAKPDATAPAATGGGSVSSNLNADDAVKTDMQTVVPSSTDGKEKEVVQ